MMTGRFASHAYLKLKDGRCHWGWCVETKVADGWFIGFTADLRSDEPETYFSSKWIAELTPCDADLCRELTATFDNQPVDAESFVDNLPDALEAVARAKTEEVV